MRVAIIGGGPAGSATAALLARRGAEVVLFEEGNRPQVIAGESLVPGVVPILQRLGIEEKVARIGIRKPGVTFTSSDGRAFVFGFDALPKKYPPYAYNVPRPAFDGLLFDTALASGAQHLAVRCLIVAKGGRLLLAPESLALVPGWKGRQPDLIVDATGRRRMSANLLRIGSRIGPRRDVAYFAHYEGFLPESPAGQVLIDHLERGWSWRIPLPGRMSFGIVLGQKAAASLGSAPAERLDAVLRRNPQMNRSMGNVRRISEVQTYGNYQLISDQGVGPNWAAVGDAFGFVDPMLSPGMMIALQGAVLLEEALNRLPLNEALASYAARVSGLLKAWMEFIAYFYDGRIFSMYEKATDFQNRYKYLPTGIFERFVRGHLASMASGFSIDSPWSRGVLRGFENFVKGGRTTESSPLAVL